MIKASSRTIVFLFPLLLSCAQAINGWESNRNSNNRTRQRIPVTKDPEIKQIEAQLQSTQAMVGDMQTQIKKLKDKIDELAAPTTPPQIVIQETASRLTVASVLALLVGGICGVFFGPRLRRRLESPQGEQLLELSNRTTELKKESDNLNGRFGLLEGRVQVIYEFLLIKGNTETDQPDNKRTPAADDGDATTPPQANPPMLSTVTDTHNGPLGNIGIVPPSEYAAAIKSATVICKTTTTNQDFRYPGKLIEQEGGRFLILSVKDGSSLHILALPTSDRLLGSDEFTYYYKNIFDCEQPVSGEIYVIAPAVMDEDPQQGGWMLHERGKLQIRR